MIYLDNSATTRPFDEVIDKMSACMREEYFNPSAVYAPAMLAGRILTETREAIASQLGGRVKVVFTSGGTEAARRAPCAEEKGISSPRRSSIPPYWKRRPSWNVWATA